jgi:cytochrome c oxidase subunit III
MSRRAESLDVSQLPSFVYGHRSLMWWSTMGVIAIEGTVFALSVGSYFYLRANADTWPPGVASPDLLWGTLNTLVMLLSILPNHYTKRAASDRHLGRARVGMFACLALATAFLGIRILEFGALNCSWDTNAYGSIAWLLLGLHTVHLVTDFLDSSVLYVLMLTGPLEGKRYVDVAENAMYWDFVVLAWLPIYAVIYWAPRF